MVGARFLAPGVAAVALQGDRGAGLHWALVPQHLREELLPGEQQVAMIQSAVALPVLHGAKTTSTKGAFLGWEGADLSAVFM